MIPKALGSASVRPLILSILAHKESYGYEIIQHARVISEGSLEWQPGILYPMLRRLEYEELIESYWHQPSGERKRRYYRLTVKGQQSLADEQQEWLKLHATFQRLWGPEPCLT